MRVWNEDPQPLRDAVRTPARSLTTETTSPLLSAEGVQGRCMCSVSGRGSSYLLYIFWEKILPMAMEPLRVGWFGMVNMAVSMTPTV